MRFVGGAFAALAALAQVLLNSADAATVEMAAAAPPVATSSRRAVVGADPAAASNSLDSAGFATGGDSEDNRLMWDIVRIARPGLVRRYGTKAQLTEAFLPNVTRNLELVNEGYGLDLELVWGPAFTMVSEVDIFSKEYMPDNLIFKTLITADVVKQAHNSTYLNSMFAARDKTTGTYYVAIAGTNGVSATSWLLEDFWVDKLVPWKGDKSGNAQIFAATNAGLHYLDMMKPLKTVPGGGKTLKEFLRANAANSIVRVTGHSQGGTLAPVLALYLEEADVSKAVTANYYASSTPGNVQFSKYFARSKLAKYAVETNNRLDMIPYVWVPAEITKLPTLYQQEYPGSANCMEKLADFLMSLLGGIDTAAYVNPNKTPTFEMGFPPASDLGGAFGGEVLGVVMRLYWGPSWKKCGPTVTQYMQQAGWQHSHPYDQYFKPVTM